MIHSLAGGILSQTESSDFVKVEIVDNLTEGFFWYKSDIIGLKEGDNVLVPFGRLDTLVKGKVIRIDKNVSSQNSPVPFKRAKYINSIVK